MIRQDAELQWTLCLCCLMSRVEHIEDKCPFAPTVFTKPTFAVLHRLFEERFNGDSQEAMDDLDWYRRVRIVKIDHGSPEDYQPGDLDFGPDVLIRCTIYDGAKRRRSCRFPLDELRESK